jgi:hypothetical protein
MGVDPDTGRPAAVPPSPDALEPPTGKREAVLSAAPELPVTIVPEPPAIVPPAQPSWTGGLGPAAVTISLLLSLILVSSSISLSESIGRLTQPPGYDDVYYMLESYNLYQLLLH